ncbi:hypothetical protein A5694_10660 [Mycolicibacter sinensis]|nr:hypothetical protein A5694_10660 [Mycolicibacter sinensis]
MPQFDPPPCRFAVLEERASNFIRPGPVCGNDGLDAPADPLIVNEVWGSEHLQRRYPTVTLHHDVEAVFEDHPGKLERTEGSGLGDVTRHVDLLCGIKFDQGVDRFPRGLAALFQSWILVVQD